MKRFLAVALILTVSASLTFAAGGRQESRSTGGTATGTADGPGWKANISSPITFDWYINFAWFARKWGENRVSKFITENTGVNVRFIVPAGNEAERLNAMIAGNALPDLITLDNGASQINEMIDAGLVEPLNKLAEQYDPYFFKVANPQLLGWFTKSDGNVYSYPNSATPPQDYITYKGQLTSNQTFLVRKDMYEGLGRPDMTTPEGFLGALRAAKQKYPMIDGQPIIPIGFHEFGDTGNYSLQSYIMNFLAQPQEAGGQYVDPNVGPDNPEYIRWLKCLRQAAQEGLISMDVFVDKRAQMEEKIAQGRYFCMLYQISDMQAPADALYARDPNMIYIAVEGPKNIRKDPPTLSGGAGISGWVVTLISKNCKDKARAIQFITYFLSNDGQLAINYGIPGVTYDIVNGIPALKPEMVQLNTTDKNRQELEYGFDGCFWMLTQPSWRRQYPPNPRPPARAQAIEWTIPYVNSTSQYSNMNMVPGTDEDLIISEIRRRWGRDLPRLILAKTEAEFDAIWSEYQKFKADRGFTKVQAAQTAIMRENKRKLGIN
jgi:putative aldouronate transport system substrate-binding protein